MDLAVVELEVRAEFILAWGQGGRQFETQWNAFLLPRRHGDFHSTGHGLGQAKRPIAIACHGFTGIVDNDEIIMLDFRAFIGAEEEYDKIMIKGIPNINSRIEPCVHGDKGTIAMVVNSIPRIINAQAGLFTMKDLPVPSGTSEDIRKYLLERNVAGR